MKNSILLAALASAPAALAHTAFTDFFVDGVPVGDGVAIRMSTDPEHATSPIASLESPEMACNVGGTKGVSRVAPVPDGALLTFEIRAWPNNPDKLRIDRNHVGPCAVYLKKVESAVSDRGAGDGWFKIFEHGYNAETERWCSDEIIDNNGLLSVQLPKGLEGGAYLARPEMLALHAAADNDPQFYTGCAQIHLESTGNLVPDETVSIPGYVAKGQPATSFNIYSEDPKTYKMPGPKVATLSARGGAMASSNAAEQREGMKPAGCLAENANWCGKEVPDYDTEKGCWASAENCWAQAEECFDQSLPTGNAGCKLWQTKCEGINAACTRMDFKGPPNKGKVLTPVKKAIDVGVILAGTVAKIDGKPQYSKPEASASAGKPNESSSDKPAPVASKPAVETKPKASAAPAPAPAPIAALPAAPKPSATKEEPKEENEDKETKPAAPATTPAPAAPQVSEACPEGWACVTVTDLAIVTTTVTVTADYNEMQRRSGYVGGARQRRWA